MRTKLDRIWQSVGPASAASLAAASVLHAVPAFAAEKYHVGIERAVADQQVGINYRWSGSTDWSGWSRIAKDGFHSARLSSQSGPFLDVQLRVQTAAQDSGKAHIVSGTVRFDFTRGSSDANLTLNVRPLRDCSTNRDQVGPLGSGDTPGGMVGRLLEHRQLLDGNLCRRLVDRNIIGAFFKQQATELNSRTNSRIQWRDD